MKSIESALEKLFRIKGYFDEKISDTATPTKEMFRLAVFMEYASYIEGVLSMVNEEKQVVNEWGNPFAVNGK